MSKPAAIENIYPLTPLQSGLLFHTLMEPNSGVYFEQLTCELHGTLDEAAFAQAWKTLVERHPILRTAFVWKGQREPVQVVHRALELPWRKEDWRGVEGEQQAEKLKAYLAADRRRGFELNRAPLMRLATIQLASNVWQLVCSHHHILLDGWSFPLLLREFGECYRAYCTGLVPQLPPARPFSSYIAWLKERDGAKAEAFWREQLRGFAAPTPLVIGHPVGAAKPGETAQYREFDTHLAPQDVQLFQATARELRITLNTLVQGAYSLVLSRYSGLDDVMFGVTVAGRPAELPGVEQIVGLFINTLPLRVQVRPDFEAAPWLVRLQDSQLAMQEFEYAGLSDMQRWSEVTPGQPLFESLLVFESYPIDSSLPSKLGGLEPRGVSFIERSNLPLTIIVLPGERMGIRVSYDASRMDGQAVERMVGHIIQVLRGLSRPGIRLGQIELLTPQERESILALPAPVVALEEGPATIHEWFMAQSRITPKAIALTDSGVQISYQELDEQSTRLARHLMAEGVEPRDRVGLLVERNAALVTGILAILKAGAAYVPMDPIYPDDRLAWIASDSGVKAVVTQRSLAGRVSGAAHICIEDEGTHADANPLDGMVGADDGAYVIYTSGSTGRPKGCVITHRNVTRLFKQTEHWFGFSAADVWTLFHSAAFDFSVWELWGSLLYGGRLVIVPYYTSREPEAFLELVRRERVTVLNQTPSAFRQFMAVEERQTSRAGLALRWVIFGGEALDLATLRPWFARHGDARPQLVNMYGITETTVHVTYRSLTTLDAEQNRGSLIGEPIPDLRLVTLDSCGQLAAVGIPGELYVAGAGLSPGYLKRPALSAERFVADPFALAGTGGRLYRTGDLARRLAGGDFEYLGRADHQVKIRGFRIELGEIESELSALPGVRECLVMMRDERLVAYVAARSGAALQADGLRGGLLQRLPEYMVPAVFVWIDKMPLTPNGKVDRAALPSPISQLEDGAGEYLAPRNEREAMLAEIWREVLQVNRVGVRDSYFALGGDSIRSLAIRSKARDKGIEFSLQDLFEKQTIEALCGGEQVVVQTASEAAPSAAPFSQLGEYDRTLLPADVEDAYPLTSLQLGMLFHSHQHAGSSQYLDTFSFQLRGSFDHAVLQASLGGLVERHAVLRTSFDLAALPEPIQRVHRQIAVPIGHSDLLGLDETAQQAAIHAFVKREATLAFNWAQAPLFRVHVHERGTSFQFTLSAHHAILDGWSVASLLTELFRDYLIGLGAPGNSPAKLESPTFGHFVALERAAASNKGSREFWTSALESAPVLALPKPFANSSAIADAATSRGRCLTLPVEVGTDVSAGLVRLAESLGVPVKSVLLTAHVRVLSLLGGNEDVVTGLVSNGRPEEVGADRLAGLFLNLLPLRLQLPEGTWADAVTAVFAMEKAMMPHRRVPLADIQRWLGAGPLLDTDFNFVNFHVFDALRGMDSLQLVDSISSEETNLALAANFSMQGVNGSVHGSLTVNQELVDHAVAQALPGLYLDVLTALAKTPRSLWRATVIGTPPLSHDTAEPFPEELLLHDLVEAQADRTPDAAAMIDEQRTLTYAQLEREANQLAHWLIGKGIGAEHRVGIAVARSAELVIAMLAALKAGAAWVPLDPDYPAERLALLERESGATVIVTDALLAENRVAIAAEPVGRPAIEVWPESAAYVLFTSGSTGTPKGVVVPHSAIVNHMFWMQGVFPLGAHDVVLQKTPAGFDAAVWEFWAPLMAGAVLVMAKPGGHQDPEYLAQVVREHEVTTLQLVPSMLKFFIEAAERTGCPSLRRVFSGGEALREETRDRFFQTFEAELVNLYGPTEVTIDSVVQRCGADGEIPIGRPIANVQAWVLDANLSPVPLGVPGELYLGGAGVARGYLGRAGLTAERFVPDHLSPWAGMRLYRTGDWVRQSADGTLYFIGRADNQVKIRGQRIELGEIEAALETIAAVERAVVLAHAAEDGRKMLAAYVIAEPGTDADELLALLRKRLPAVMVPAHIQFVESFPLGPNGKLDRRALPLPGLPSAARGRSITAPETELEIRLAAIWKNVLGVSEIGIHDDFFELGGDSIQSLRLVSIAAHEGLRLRPKHVFEHPTIAALALVVEMNAPAAAELRVDHTNIPLTPVQQDFFALNLPNPHHWNQAVLVKTRVSLNFARMESAWSLVASKHSAFRLRFAREAGGWRQFLADAAAPPILRAKLSELEQVGAQANASLHIEHGPLFKAVFAEGGSGPGRLLIVGHHLAVDGVSWRILLQELAMACEEESVPFEEEVSFSAWAASLAEEARSEQTKAEEARWLAVANGAASALPVDFADGTAGNTEGAVGSVQWSLDKAQTGLLLRELPMQFRCRVEEILLTALAASLEEWSGGEPLFELEGHGREEAITDLNISNTIGWFTNVYPVRLARSSDAWQRLRGVKETLRAVPRGGIGWGLLSHSAESRELFRACRPEVSFNYLGQIDLALHADGPFRPAHETTGKDRAADAPRRCLIDVIAMVSGGCLHVEWLYSNNVHLAATIEARAQRFGAELQFLLQTGDAAKAIVDSDFPLAKIDHTLTSQLLTGGAVEDIWPLTPLQEGMLIHALHGGEGGVYCQQVAVDLRGQVNMAALHSAWRELARRHAVLRVEFRWQDLPVPHQIVRKDVAVAIAMLDWSIEEAGQLEQRFSQWLAIDRAAGFDLATAPLWRVTVIQLEHDRWKLVWTHHHLLLDGWSLPIVFEQLISEYAVACGGAVERQPAPFRYANYLQWLAQRDTSTEAAFWKAELAGYRPAAQLELGPAPLSTTPARATIAWELTPAATNSLRRLAQRLQITLGTCVQGVWGLVLARWTKKSEALFGLVVAGRPAELPGAETAVGMFINTLPLRIPVPRDVPVEQWLRELHQKTASLRQYEQSRLVDVQSWSEVPRGQALFEAVLIIENYPLSGALGEPVGGVSFGSVDSFEQTSLPLNLYAVPGEKLELRLEYLQTRFRDDVMHSFAASISGLLEALPRHAGGTLPALPMLPPAALAELKASAGPPALAATGSAVHQRIAAQAVQQPDAIAIMGGAEVITYAELEAKSNQLAHYLIAKGAGSGALIGVYLERSPRMLIALLGIVKSGAAYVPMDPAFPMERLAMVVEDSKLAFVVMEGVEKQCGLFPASIQQVSLEADAASIAACATAAVGGSFGADELAYVIFTSGSTGRPKGVQVTHGALANFLDHFSVSPGLKQSDILLAVTTLSFDIAALELFLPLVCGARLVIASRETTADGRALAKLMEQSGITVMQGTPATWQILLASDWRPRGPFQAWCGGEALPMDLARELVQRGITLWNFYGPTETTIWSTTQLVAEVADAAFIGIPIKNTWAWVLDENLEPAPTGMTGELYLGGEGLARGYIGRPGLTAERFIPSPFGNGERLYATGDEARWESGVLRFLGRRDHQVKIRGFRVEIEDIEVALRAVPNVRGAAVAARNDHQGKPRLVAWVQGLNDAGGASALRARLLEALPEYMVPGTIVAIEALPMTPNGKLDRRALPDEVAAADAPRAFITPRDAIEQVLADLWQEVLGVERVGAEDHFFELGGHSLLAAQALGRIRKYFQVDVSLRTFFETATPAAVAVALKAAEPAAGRMLKIASALLRLRSMSDEERAILKRKAAQSAGAGRA